MTSTQQISKEAIKAFPLTDYTTASAVTHARTQWEAAKAYLASRSLTIKPIINLKTTKPVAYAVQGKPKAKRKTTKKTKPVTN